MIHLTKLKSIGIVLSALVCSGGAMVLFDPNVAHAAVTTTLSTGWSIVPAECNCIQGGGWGCLLKVIQNLITFVIYIGIFASVLIIAYAGFTWILSPANPEGISKAKTMLWNAGLGLLIILSTWLIVNTLFTFLTNYTVQTITSKILTTNGDCLPAGQNPPAQAGSGSSNTSGTTGSTQTGGNTSPSGANAGAGSCSVAPPGTACDPQSAGMQAAFGSNAEHASQYCMKETGGTAIESGTDKTADGYSYSAGFFQMNITNSFAVPVDGKNCSQAFSGPCQSPNLLGGGKCSVHVVDMQLYNDCIAAAKDSTLDMQQAGALSKGGSDWSHWNNECN